VLDVLNVGDVGPRRIGLARLSGTRTLNDARAA
jgi:hypothetical protein